ncbi:IPTL-CTERM sorting domain-containing protein, partial [Pseudomonadota bacterium]
VILARFDQTAFPTGLLANITFTIDNAATAGSKPLDGVMVGVSDTGGTDLPLDTVTVTDGAINVLGAAYVSNPAVGTIGLAGKVGDPAMQNVMISNGGVAGTTLTGSCTETADPDNVFTISGDTDFSVVQGAAAATVTVACDTNSGLGDKTPGEMTCTHNGDGTGAPSPAIYPLNCSVLDKDPAMYDDNPDAGMTIDITAGMDTKVGDTPPASTLSISNTATGDAHNLTLDCSNSGAEITASQTGALSVAPGMTSPITFTCPTGTAGMFTTDYSCEYTVDGSTPPSDSGIAVSWTYTCDVREAQANVDPTPPSGTEISSLAQPGGTADFMVTFSEVGGEGVDGSLDSCSLADGTNFAITGPTLPAAVPAGGSTTVTVVGTDPGGVESASDTLTCIYTDGDGEPTTVTYPLLLEIGGDGTFEVSKVFSDNRPGSVDVTLTCNTGLPLTQTASISNGNPVFFVVRSYESGAMDCSVTEDPDSGYMAEFAASGDSESVDDDPQAPGCHFTAVSGGDANVCAITNSPEPVDVVIDKEWVMSGATQGGVSTNYILTLWCDSEIIGGTQGYPNGVTSAPSSITDWHLMFYGDGSDTFTAMVVPNFPTSSCWVEENIQDDAVETENGCMDISVSVGNPAACTITNTVFFEGIPTLNQYGLAIMALLMLGIGMVGFRRFT